jgi:hypothetical protein
MAALFCVKTIQQSTPNPCQLNTLTVTFVANVPFMAGQTEISIRGLSNADFPTGEIQILDGSMGGGNHLLFGNGFAGTPGTGHWNDGTDTLTLSVLQNTEAAAEYVIRFQVYNPPNAQGKATPQIEAKNVGNSKLIYEAGENIAAVNLEDPPTTRSNPLDDPLHVIATEFTHISVSSDDINPCANRTITITLATNVPVWSRCKPIFTFSGFKEAYAHILGRGPERVDFGVYGRNDYIPLSGPDRLSFAPVNLVDADRDTSVDFDTDPREGAEVVHRHNSSIAGYASWSNGAAGSVNDMSQIDKNLTLFVNQTLASNERSYSFSFTVVNPAAGQTAGVISFEAVGQPMSPRTVFSTMDVAYSQFTTRGIRQSSPWPCDDNTITVTLVSSSPLYRSCQGNQAGTTPPGVTISGLTGTMSPTASSNYLPITFTDVRLGEYNATWNSSTGTLVFSVIDVLQQSGLAYLTDLSMNFSVVNRATDQASPAITITHTIRNVAAEGGQAQYTRTDTMIKHSVPIEVSPGETLLPSVNGDGEPMRIRDATFLVKNITQSSPYPCDDNNIISVSLRSSVPLWAYYCTHDIMIKGLKHYLTPDNQQLNITEASYSGVSSTEVDTVFRWGVWNRSAGELTMNVSEGQRMVAGKTYVLSFKLRNPTQARSTFLATGDERLTVQATPVQSSTPYRGATGSSPSTFGSEDFQNTFSATEAVLSTATLNEIEAYNIKRNELRPSYIRELAYESNGFLANQSKPFPCAVNTINVGLRLNVPLLRTCQHLQDASAFNFTPSVRITGLFGSTTAHGSLLTISGDAAFSGSEKGVWSNPAGFETPGVLKVTPQSETVAGQIYYFRFDLHNRAEGQNAPAVSIEVDTLECCSAATCSAANTGCLRRASTPFFNTTTGVETPWQTAHHTSGSFMDREEVRPPSRRGQRQRRTPACG